MSNAQLDLYQELILEHKRTPRNFGTLACPTHQARGYNPQCGDDLNVQVRVERGRVADIRFNGRGCAICLASASMMTEAVRGAELDAVADLHERFRSVLTGRLDVEAAGLGKLASLAPVQRYPGRIKCALLGWHALMHALAGPEQGQNATAGAGDTNAGTGTDAVKAGSAGTS